jgi:hypothetical protein
MLKRDQIQEALLCERGVEPIPADEEDESLGLQNFFHKLRDRVQQG